MKQSLPPKVYDALQHALDELHREQLLDSAQLHQAKSYYKKNKKLSPITALLSISAILIGIGLIALISSFWATFTPNMKFLVLWGGTALLFTAAFFLERQSVKAGRSLYYAGSLAFGASVFLLTSMFLPEYTTSASFLTIVGLLPLIYFLQDRLLLGGAFLTMIITSFNFWSTNAISEGLIGLLLTSILISIHEYSKRPNTLLYSLEIIALAVWFNVLFMTLDVPAVFQALFFILFSIGLLYLRTERYKAWTPWMTTLILAFAGLSLTFPETWENGFIDHGHVPAILWTIVFTAVLFLALKRFTLQSIVLIGLVTFRIYSNYTYELIPKSLFFLLAGIILFIIGFLLERAYRKKEGGSSHEQ